MSHWNYDVQTTDKSFKMDTHHVMIVVEIRLEME